MQYMVGVDGGSVSIKLVVLDADLKLQRHFYKRHYGRPVETFTELISPVFEEFQDFYIAFTGSTGKKIGERLGTPIINELIAQIEGVRHFEPSVNTVMEMGGEDSKLIILDGENIKDFSLNSVCAAGTGSFLDQQAERLGFSIEEFSEIALKSSKPPRIAGRCSVFAKSDMIHLQQIATPVEDIIGGLCFAVARNFKGSIVRGRKLVPKVAFQGGVALNRGVVRAFREVFGLKELVVPAMPHLTGAVGAVIRAEKEGDLVKIHRDDLSALSLKSEVATPGQPPLIEDGDNFEKRHLSVTAVEAVTLSEDDGKEIPAYLGIDIGSISTNLALIDEEGRLISKRYLMTAGRPIEAVRRGLREIWEEVGDRVSIRGVGTTGSGRYMIADFVGADIVKNEITAQAKAAAFIDPQVDTIFEIGGQDSKYISLKDGIIVDFEMNKACAAGTGSFLEEQAEKLDVSIKGEFAETAFRSSSPCRLGERCTVFMENSLMSNLQRGASREDLLAGLSYSIVENYINRVVAGRNIGERIFFQGGTAFNKAVVAAFEKFLGREITVPPNHDVTGAIGMALIAKEFRDKNPGSSTFKGFDLANRPYEVSSFECKGCENHCEINRVKIEGESGYLFYGGRCEKYDIRRRRGENLPDLFRYRMDALLEPHRHYQKMLQEGGISPTRGRIGIPFVFFFHDFLPFWSTLMWELGYEPVVSSETNARVVELGVEKVLADTCFPVKVGYGHVRDLLERGIDQLLIPSFINMAPPESRYERGHACPLTQSFPYQIRVAFPEARVIAPVVNVKSGEKALCRELKRVFKREDVETSTIERAFKKALSAQREFYEKISRKAGDVLSETERVKVVVFGRPYNAFDRGVNLDIPRKLATLDVLAIPMDFLPTPDIYDDWPDMYWRSGQRILSAARYIKGRDDLYPILIGNFSCGPDSFIIKYLERELGSKPLLHIEIDEHSADAGAITRCEAFLDSLMAQRESGRKKKPKVLIPKRTQVELNGKGNGRRRRIYIPPMSDHAYAIEAAFEYVGVPAEVLPRTDAEAIAIGRRYVSGKECYPCAVTTGDMLKKVLSSDFNPDESAFFMPSGTGPCRFGQYNLFQRMILADLGFKDVPIFSPVQDVSFYTDLGVVGNDFIKRSWQGIVAIDLLTKLLHETRPYERQDGETQRVYEHYLERLKTMLRSRSNGDVEKLLKEAAVEFNALKGGDERRPVIGIVGEIFVRSNRFSNEDLVRKIEALGGEAWLSPVDEWIYYINHMSLRKALRKFDRSGIIQFFLKKFYQKRVSRRYEKEVEGFLRTAHEPDTPVVLKKASPYLDDSFEGEAVLSIGKAIDMIERGASGIINAMPFGCMPGTVVTAIMNGISETYGVPFISIPYDGTESPTVSLQMEAFMEQARRVRDMKNQDGRR